MASLRDLPKVDRLASDPSLKDFPSKVRTRAARMAVTRLRRMLQEGVDWTSTPEAIAVEEAQRIQRASLAPAINMTGVILHTGLGRARLAREAVEAIDAVAASHSSLEIDLDSGIRGNRQGHVRDLLCELTQAQDALVVNNGAAALVLALQALATGREIVLSRGEMVEIGGSFRLPEIVATSGALLREVGCTNKTRLRDYEDAIGPDTAALLRCHPSNFKIVGFQESPSLRDLAALAHRRGVIVIDDVGSGCLVETERFGLAHQPTLQESVAAGADIVIASGDKLLGGPQAGIILGRKDLIDILASHPLARAVRIDKLCLAGLEATLRLMTTGQEFQVPAIAALNHPLADLKRAAQKLATAYGKGAVVERGQSEIGGGSMPGEVLQTWRCGLRSHHPNDLADILRSVSPPVVGRIERDVLWLDPRTATKDEVAYVARILEHLGNDK
jgi:L-seryl-tRNA(Ser) seleniumtransferase